MKKDAKCGDSYTTQFFKVFKISVNEVNFIELNIVLYILKIFCFFLSLIGVLPRQGC